MATAPTTAEPLVPFEEAMRLIGLDAYPEQALVAARLARTAESGKVGFIEAPTATGKTLVVAHHALDLAANEGGSIVVAVPTIELAHQTHDAIVRMARAHPRYASIITQVVLGRQEFISTASLRDFAATMGGDAGAAMTAWLEAGAPGRNDGYMPHTLDGLETHLAAAGIGIELPASIGLGPRETEDDATESYKAQFADADVIVVTHAMLARDLAARFMATSRERLKAGMTVDVSADWAERREIANLQRLSVETGDEGRLPAYRRLIVDEAHLLRENVESAMATSTSLTSLARHVEALSQGRTTSGATIVPAASLKAVKRVRKALSDNEQAIGGAALVLDWNVDETFGPLIQALVDALSRIATRKVPAHLDADAVAVERALFSFRHSLTGRDAVRTELSWSPIEAFPAITVGRQGLASEFLLLWGRLKSAALVSATLYTENVAGPSLGYTAGRLSVPEAQRLSFSSIDAPWLREPVTVLLPSQESAPALQPRDGDGRSAWLDRLALKIEGFATGTGTLVLSTSRSVSGDLARLLKAAGHGDRILDGTKGRVSALKPAFVKMAREGKSPIWLAQGPAWTGLDLPDDVLDGVAITRLPYPRPQTMTQARKTRRSDQGNDAASSSTARDTNYGPAQIAQMAMTFKQGVGRLVRSRHAGPKRLMVLDGRVVTAKTAGGVGKFLKTYRIECMD